MYSGSDDEQGEGLEREVEQGEGHKEREVEQGEELEGEGKGQEKMSDLTTDTQHTISVSNGSSSIYTSCVSEVDKAEPGPGSHTLSPTVPPKQPQSNQKEQLEASSKTLTSNQPSQPHTAPSHPTEVENGLTGQLQAPPRPQAPAPPPSLGDDGPASPTRRTKFNNLLDKCDAEESDIVKPKPRFGQPPTSPQAGTGARVGGGDYPSHHRHHAHPPGLYEGEGMDQHPRGDMTSLTDTVLTHVPLSGGERTATHHHPQHHQHPHTTTSPEMSPSPLGEIREDPGPLQRFLFPISSSPVDLITMLSRLASFTAELLTVLTPKIRKTNFARNSKVKGFRNVRAKHYSAPFLLSFGGRRITQDRYSHVPSLCSGRSSQF